MTRVRAENGEVVDVPDAHDFNRGLRWLLGFVLAGSVGLGTLIWRTAEQYTQDRANIVTTISLNTKRLEALEVSLPEIRVVLREVDSLRITLRLMIKDLRDVQRVYR